MKKFKEHLAEVNMRPPNAKQRIPTTRQLKNNPDLAQHYRNNPSAFEHPSEVMKREREQEAKGNKIRKIRWQRTLNTFVGK